MRFYSNTVYFILISATFRIIISLCVCVCCCCVFFLCVFFLCVCVGGGGGCKKQVLYRI